MRCLCSFSDWLKTVKAVLDWQSKLLLILLIHLHNHLLLCFLTFYIVLVDQTKSSTVHKSILICDAVKSPASCIHSVMEKYVIDKYRSRSYWYTEMHINWPSNNVKWFMAKANNCCVCCLKQAMGYCFNSWTEHACQYCFAPSWYKWLCLKAF